MIEDGARSAQKKLESLLYHKTEKLDSFAIPALKSTEENEVKRWLGAQMGWWKGLKK